MKNFWIHRTAALLFLSGAWGCNFFEPSLSSAPFLCGGEYDTPKCPDGYGAVFNSQGRCECHQGAKSGFTESPPVDQPDAAGPISSCDDDSSVTKDPGGNESVAQAIPSGISQAMPFVTIPGLSICPADDIDVFQVITDQDGQEIHATAVHDKRYGALKLAVKGSNGSPLALGVHDERGVSVSYAVPVKGVYFLEVSSDDLEQNYNLQIEVTGGNSKECPPQNECLATGCGWLLEGQCGEVGGLCICCTCDCGHLKPGGGC